MATVLSQQGTFLPRKMKDILPIPGPSMTLLQSEVTKGWLVMIGCYSWGNTELQSIPQQSIRYTELSFSPSAAAWHPSRPCSPACKPWWASEGSSVGWIGHQWLAVLLGRWAGGQAVLTLRSWAAQLCTSSFHCDIIFDIQFEILNSFNAISQHNDSNKAVPLAFDLTTKGKVKKGRKQPQLC